jgi:hypothetical protein
VAIRVPVDITAEFRGLSAAGQFKSRETGELVEIPPKFKFEVEVGLGDDVDLLVLSQSVLDKARSDFPIATLRRGEHVRLLGMVVLQDRGSDRDSYLSVTEILRIVDAASKASREPVKA